MRLQRVLSANLRRAIFFNFFGGAGRKAPGGESRNPARSVGSIFWELGRLGP